MQPFQKHRELVCARRSVRGRAVPVFVPECTLVQRDGVESRPRDQPGCDSLAGAAA